MLDIVARNPRDTVHHLKRSWDDLLHEIRLLADNRFHDNVREGQHVPQLVQKTR